MKINGLDAYLNWGVTLGDTSLAALKTPAPLKGYVSNKSPLRDGADVVTVAAALPKVDERDVQLTFYIHASTPAQFEARYDAFTAVLMGGKVNLWTRHQQGVTYRLLYQSASQYSEFNGRLGKIVARFAEPNPADRENPS